MIYFIQQGEDGPVKIGYATVIEKRFRALQSASPYPLKVIGSMQGSVVDEKKLHLQFSKHRLQGEWFEPDIEIIKYAADLLVIPSRQEAMSIVVLEAGITGTPVMLTDQCGFNAIETIGGGRVVAASVAGLQTNLVEILQDPNLLKDMGGKLKDYVGQYYGWDQIARKYVKVFEQVLKSQ